MHLPAPARKASRLSRRYGTRWVGRRAGDDGYIMTLFALLIVPIMAFAALGVDVGSWYARGAQLQKAADAAALAGVVWMPNLATATEVAETALQRNGVVAGDSIDVSIEEGSEANTLRVTVSDHDPASYFSGMFLHPTLTRSATAQYVLPVPLGSPLNYFGGDATQYPGSPAGTTSSYADPGDGTLPDSYQCAMAASGQGSTPPADDPNYGATPPGYYDSSGTYHSGDPSGYYGSWSWSDNYAGGEWDWRYYTRSWGGWNRTTVDYPLCTWSTARPAVPGPISSDQSPGFWAAVEGPGTNAINGDAYSPRCYAQGGYTGNRYDSYCTSLTNPQHRDTGYWYTITIPTTNAPSSVAVQVFDASYDPTNGQTSGAGDNALGDPHVFHTSYTVYKQNVASSFSDRTEVSGCQWDLTDEAAYQNTWQTLCTLTPSAGDVYQVNVRSSDPDNEGDGSNNYALRAVPNAGGGMPKLAAYGDMAIYNNIEGSSGSYATANFYLVEVPDKFAGKTLDVDLWDAGDTNGNAWITVMEPSTTSTAGTPVPADECTYSADHPSPSPSGVGNEVSERSPTSSDQNFSGGSGTCSVKTSNGGAIYNGEWIHLRVTIPTSYTCDDTVDPVTTAGSCWWQIRYTFGSQAHDNTTWSAHIEGNPVHLIE